MKRLLSIVFVAVLAAACGSSSTTSPTPTPPAATTPTPTTFTLSGTVTSTTGGAVSGATVRIADGANAGKSTTTAASGAYSITSLTVSGMTVTASASNYNSLSKGVTLTSSQTLDFQLAPTPLFTASGVGNTVFDMPATVSRLHVVGTYTGSSSNFIVWVGPAGSSCSVSIGSGCRLIVNEIIGTFNGRSSTYDAIVQTGGGGTVSISNSSGVSWSLTEVR